jgi:hypothetical protein
MTKPGWILAVVDSFYDKAKTDVLIGYHFRNIKDFEEHTDNSSHPSPRYPTLPYPFKQIAQ